MSGHKVATVTISQEEYRKLYEAERDLRYSLNDIHMDVIENQAEEQQSIFDRLLAFNQQKIGHYSHHTAPKRPDHVNDVEHLKMLFDLEFEKIHQIIDQQGQSINHYDQDGKLEVNHLTDQIVELRQQLDDLNLHLAEKSSTDLKDLYPIENEVELSMEELRNHINHLSQFQNHPAFPEDDFERIVNGFNFAISDAKNGFYDAALSLLQSTLFDARHMIYRTELDQSMLFYLTAELQLKIGMIRQKFSSQPVIEAITRDGHFSGVYLDLFDWSDGKYTALLEDLDNLESWLDNNHSSITFENLRDFEKSLNQIDESFLEVIHISRINAINSQLKYEVANQVLLALISQGYVPEVGNYCENQGEERYYASAKNGAGSTVTILIDNTEKNTVGSKLSILSSDSQLRTQYELNRRASEIKEAVKRYGLEISNLTEDTASEYKQITNSNTRLTTRINYHGK
jgi:hypothetical protein